MTTKSENDEKFPIGFQYREVIDPGSIRRTSQALEGDVEQVLRQIKYISSESQKSIDSLLAFSLEALKSLLLGKKCRFIIPVNRRTSMVDMHHWEKDELDITLEVLCIDENPSHGLNCVICKIQGKDENGESEEILITPQTRFELIE